MNVDPAHSSSVQPAFLYKANHLSVRNHRGLVHLLIGLEQPLSTAPIAYQQFAEYELMADNFVPPQKCVQLRRVWFVIPKESNPD